VLALLLARSEVNRPRKQDALRAELKRGSGAATRSDQDEAPSA
jgi:hypothetical protein